MAGCGPSRWWTPAADAGGSDLDAKVSRQSERPSQRQRGAHRGVERVTGYDEEDARIARSCARWRRQGMLVANKVDDAGPHGLHLGGAALGLGRPVPRQRPSRPGGGRPCSTASHLSAEAPPMHEEPAVREVEARGAPCRVSPWRSWTANGKSTLFNRLPGEDRAVGQPAVPPGTRSDTVVAPPDGHISGSSTPAGIAGARPRSTAGTEYYSLVRASRQWTASESRLCDRRTVERHGRTSGLAESQSTPPAARVVVLTQTKWGAARRRAAGEVSYQVGGLHFIGEAPGSSCRPHARAWNKLLPACRGASRTTTSRARTRRVNGSSAPGRASKPASPHGREGCYYATQAAVRPAPTLPYSQPRGAVHLPAH